MSRSCICCGAGRGLDLRVLKRRNTVPEYVAALRISSEGQRNDPNCGNDGQADKEPNRCGRNLVERPGCISHAHQRLIGDKCSVLVPRLSSIISIASQEGQAKTSSSGRNSSLGIVRMCFMVSPQEKHASVGARSSGAALTAQLRGWREMNVVSAYAAPLIQAGALPNSQPPAPGARPRPVIVNTWVLTPHRQAFALQGLCAGECTAGAAGDLYFSQCFWSENGFSINDEVARHGSGIQARCLPGHSDFDGCPRYRIRQGWPASFIWIHLIGSPAVSRAGVPTPTKSPGDFSVCRRGRYRDAATHSAEIRPTCRIKAVPAAADDAVVIPGAWSYLPRGCAN